MKKHSKLLALLLAGAMMAGGGMLAACASGPSAEELVKQSLTEELDPLKNHDQAVVDELAAGVDSTGSLAEFGVDSKQYVLSLIDGFDYRIDSVTSDENTATASVTLTLKSLSEAQTIADGLSQEFIDGGKGATMTEEELNAQVGKMLMQSIAQATPRDKTIEVGYTLEDGTWTLDPGTEDAIYNAFFD